MGQRIRPGTAKPGETVAEAFGLTRREDEVLSQIIEGYSNKEIGRLLGISPRTVEIHRLRASRKLNARSAGDLVAKALRHSFLAMRDDEPDARP